MLESEFQNKLIQELKRMFKGCIVTKLDASHIQGIPDLLILYNDKWATLECKKSVRAKKQPNQEYYVGRMNEKMGGNGSAKKVMSEVNKLPIHKSTYTQKNQ